MTTVRLRADLPASNDLNPTNADQVAGATLTFDDKVAKALLKAGLADEIDPLHGTVIPAKKAKAKKAPKRKAAKKSR